MIHDLPSHNNRFNLFGPMSFIRSIQVTSSLQAQIGSLDSKKANYQEKQTTRIVYKKGLKP
jgi:hypothetical protein